MNAKNIYNTCSFYKSVRTWSNSRMNKSISFLLITNGGFIFKTFSSGPSRPIRIPCSRNLWEKLKIKTTRHSALLICLFAKELRKKLLPTLNWNVCTMFLLSKTLYPLSRVISKGET